uniref:Reverse transcriptase domain-containing protein n=1 Tax=Tanacetum cinerariifolium TaxID=118510 RepID=A0A699JCU7_TANCI|nr:hypothetical protein [Tanacetum cinerariifolium]
MVIIVKDELFSEKSLRKIFLHLVLNMEFSKILLSQPMTIPTLLMLLESHSLAIKTPIKIPHKVIHKSITIVATVVIPTCYDDDDDDYAFAITPNEPINSLSMGDEHLDAILITESDKFMKSSIENLVPIPSESEGEPECDIDSLFDEFAGKLTLLKSIPPGIDETNFDHEEETHCIKRLLYDNSYPRPPEEFVFENSEADIESFSPSPIPVEDSDSLMKEINLSLIRITQCRLALRKMTMTLKGMSSS